MSRRMTRDERSELVEMASFLVDQVADAEASATRWRSADGAATSFETNGLAHYREQVASALSRLAQAKTDYRREIQRTLNDPDL